MEDGGIVKNAADNRAHRAKVIRARKSRSRLQLDKHISKSATSSGSEQSSESFSSGRKKVVRERKIEQRAGAVGKLVKRRDGRECGRVPKRPRTAGHDSKMDWSMKEDGCVTPTSGTVLGKKDHLDLSPVTRVGGEGSDDSDPRQSNSLGVQDYSQREQKEIFDAVKSLQILAKTSTPSNSKSALHDVEGSVKKSSGGVMV